MSLAPWRSPISRALHRNRSLAYSRYVQLATVRADGSPANRTVVFRGFLDDSNQLKFVIDRRSEKVEQIQQNLNSEVCWYFPNTREQFRLSGGLALVGADYPDSVLLNARETMWKDLSDSARIQFAWSDPGQPRDPTDPFQPPPPDASEPLSNFCLLLLEPHRVDHLELRGEPQNRWLYVKDEQQGWSVQAINP